MILFISYLIGKRWLGATREYLNKGRWYIVMPTDARRFETLAYQQQE
jgi:hypothetical protein